MGDVSLLAADLVGPTGSVLGIDREPIIVDRARERAEQADVAHRVSFERADIDRFEDPHPFDAIVGRYVLLYLSDPVAALRHLSTLVRGGGLLAFHELDFGSPIQLYPEAPLWQWAYGLLGRAARAVGVPPDFGKRLVRTFLDAGLGFPAMQATMPVGGGPGSYIYPWLAESVRTVLPILERNTS
jgi:ubiquinone/menaquinone biosynthesis C-methylase UbiE